MDYSKTGRLIAKKRKDRDYTLEKLSKLLGVSPQTKSLWENGQRYPVYNEKNRMLIWDLEKGLLSNVELNYSGYPFSQLQYEEMRDDFDE